MPPEPETETEPVDTATATVEVPAEKIFGREREIVILHDGHRYRLRITRKNKLILQK